jgi:hypothetical protein
VVAGGGSSSSSSKGLQGHVMADALISGAARMAPSAAKGMANAAAAAAARQATKQLTPAQIGKLLWQFLSLMAFMFIVGTLGASWFSDMRFERFEPLLGAIAAWAVGTFLGLWYINRTWLNVEDGIAQRMLAKQERHSQALADLRKEQAAELTKIKVELVRTRCSLALASLGKRTRVNAKGQVERAPGEEPDAAEQEALAQMEREIAELGAAETKTIERIGEQLAEEQFDYLAKYTHLFAALHTSCGVQPLEARRMLVDGRSTTGWLYSRYNPLNRPSFKRGERKESEAWQELKQLYADHGVLTKFDRKAATKILKEAALTAQEAIDAGGGGTPVDGGGGPSYVAPERDVELGRASETDGQAFLPKSPKGKAKMGER